MHVLFRESHGLDETATPQDLGQDPADLVVLSFSDSDLGAFAAGWRRGRESLPSLRLANLAALTHPLSVDTYIDRTLAAAKGILIRLIGGAAWWAYGVEQVSRIARERGIALAVLPADGRPDPALDAASTLPVSTLRRLQALCEAGGEIAAQGALAQLALAAGLYAGPVPGPKTLPAFGLWHPDSGPLAAVPDGTGQHPEPHVLPIAGTDGARQHGLPAGPGGMAATPGGRNSPHGMSAGPDAPPVPTAMTDRDRPHGVPRGPGAGTSGAPLIVIPFYRAWLAAADTAGVAALIRGFEAKGFRALGLYLPSLKDPAAAHWLRAALPVLAPVAIVNTTAFSARDSAGSPLDAAGVPVFQAIHATSTRAAWATSDRGLSPADLAMHVALPEVDGRIAAGVVSFKETAAPDPALQFARAAHAPDPARIEATVARVAGWHRLATIPAAEKRVALVLSTYPGKTHRMAHAVGLDALASAEAMLEDLAATGHAIAPGAPLDRALLAERILWPLADYRAALATLPEPLRKALADTHGRPEDDPAIIRGAFPFAATLRGKVLVALQPERSPAPDREGEYHDTARVACHAYVAFYLWLRQQTDALVHIGAHGTLEWLPGKAAALSDACWPEALTGALPVIYPFIVNDPGEAAQARRRLGAVTLGHLPPPLAESGMPPALARLERLLDEYSTADGLDPARRSRLIAAIRAEAQAAGVETDLNLPAEASPAEAITRIDRFVCDVKESQFGDGLHIWGRGTPHPQALPPAVPPAAGGTAPERPADPGQAADRTAAPDLLPSMANSFVAQAMLPASRPCLADRLGHPRSETQPAPATGDPASITAERRALTDALNGKPIPPGPSGSPFRGRADVLPTGRNLYGTDPRAVPSRAAHAQGVKLAEELVRRHLQDHGDWPRGLVVNLWGSATLRTAGEEFAMALHLAGVKPVWDEGSDRVTGFEVIPLTLMDRPRIEVTLRVSGLFRDTFPDLAKLFEAAATALRRRDEAADMNPYTLAPEGPRVFAPAPGSYGLGLSLGALTEEARQAAGEAWLAASAHSAEGAPARAALETRLRGADTFVHTQDLPETDLLLAEDYAAHEAGFAAAMARLGAPAPKLYHLDATRPETPRARPLAEEIARITRARAANPRWIAGMMRHGFRGAAEIAATLDHLAAFAHLAGVVPAHLFELYHQATLDMPEVRGFLAEANPGALAAMEAQFAALAEGGFWQPRSNSRAMGLA